ncbi:four helix bundle protein [Pedobacter montanisoli]|uniref:Four helix bundle protein n=1 Tax=Pedobacter montanisoli TaxID=2923277 RepID=A0ABS9ZU51_9SPHI|nr:four helix bundle protein [Pedobacter montanisoli]MCJ0742115.1 four helix bundle protein [Pedobacter montanisoli]
MQFNNNMAYQKYTELEVWKVARTFTAQVYKITANFPKEETYGLTSQIRRCAVSVPSNIAEGSGRQHTKETIRKSKRTNVLPKLKYLES